MAISLLILVFAVMSVRGVTFLVRDAHRQARGHSREPVPEKILPIGRPVEPAGWSALDDHQLNRLLRNADSH
jgi:hypothetical protein